MKRAPFVLGATAAGLAAVLSFQSRTPGTALGASGGSSSGTTGSTVPKGAGSSGSPTTTTTTPAGGRGAATTSPPTTAAGSASARTAVGKLENYGYGEFQVAVTVQGGRLTKLQVRTLKTAEPYSQQLAVQVLPMLRQQAEKAQSAKIQGISGATYTSEAYALSMQSALDKLHFH